MTQPSSQSFAAHLLANFVACGVTDFYLAPGARSQALAIAADQLAQAKKASLTVRLDERSMGFMALGRSLAIKKPVVVITTSGTAVANLHPAVLEAHHSSVPLILLTADRPARLRGKGANQTTHQVGIFAQAVKACIDVSVPEQGEYDPAELALRAIELSLSENPGPVQLNLQFQEPLSDVLPDASEILVVEKAPEAFVTPESVLEVEVSKCAVVVAGSGSGQAAVDFAIASNLPLLAEPSSGSRHSKHVVVDYVSKLGTELFDRVDQVFVFGKPTLSRPIQKLIASKETYVANSAVHGHFDPSSTAKGFSDVLLPRKSAPDSWLASWQQETAGPSRRGQLAITLWEATLESDQLLFGASQIIREADNALPAKELSVFANRGLAGIDGTVATGLGLAQNGKQTRVLLGDLTLLHDASSMNLTGLGELNIQLVVGNDHGGEIFKKLEVAKLVSQSSLEKLFLTPQRVNFEALAATYGWSYKKVLDFEELEQALSLKGAWLIDFAL